VRWSRYGPEFRDPLIDKEHYRKALTKEEKYEQELKKTQLVKAAPASQTSSVFADPVIRLDGNSCFMDWNYPGTVYGKNYMIQP
jgi:small subunit ribosomal protein S7